MNLAEMLLAVPSATPKAPSARRRNGKPTAVLSSLGADKRKAAIEQYRLAMLGRGPMTTDQIAAAIGKPRNSVTQAIRDYLRATGHLRQRPSVPARSNSFMHVYEWEEPMT